MRTGDLSANQPLTRIHMGFARVAMDLTDGSERGEYVSQDYILHTLGRPVRSVNLMYLSLIHI